jgi:hypothetical protein
MAKRSKLVDQFGKPMAFNGSKVGQFSQLTNRYRNENYFQQRGAVDFDKALTAGGFFNMLSASRWLFQNSGSVFGALQEQANFSFPMTPVYTGKDKEFGVLALEWLVQWHKINNVRGPAFDRSNTERLRMQAIKVDGDFGTILVRNRGGYPMVQHVRSHRIHDGKDNGGIVDGGRYDGARLHNGIIMNRDGRAIAYRVQVGEEREDTEDISSRDMFLSYRPMYSDSSRGLTHLVTSTKSFSDIFRLREYEMRAQHAAASVSLIERNDSGGPEDEVAEIIGGNDAAGDPGVAVERMEGGMIRYFRSNSGGGLEAFESNRPSVSSMDFEARIMTEAFFGMEWDPSLSLRLQEPGGALARAVIQKIRRSIQNIQKVEVKAAFREDLHGLANAIRIGALPQPSDGNIFSWKYNPPKLISVDTGNDEKLKHESYKLGLTTRAEIASQNGRDWSEDLAQRETESRELLEVADRIKKDFSISLEAAIGLIEQRTPNPAPIVEMNGDGDLMDENGDPVPVSPEGAILNEDGGESTDIDPTVELKAEADTYGILVRAGAVTPQIDDESHFRTKAGLPGISAKASEAWGIENDVRRPITIAPVPDSTLKAEDNTEPQGNTDEVVEDETKEEDES